MRLLRSSVLALAAGCADLTPGPGEAVALRVSERVTLEWFRHGRQIDVANAIARGVDEPSIEAGRLVVLVCAQPDREPNPELRWVVLLPGGMTLREGDVVSFRPGTHYGRAGPLGTLVDRLPRPAPADLYTWKYGKTVRCATGRGGTTLQARFGFAFGRNDVREYRLHRERMRGVSEEEVRAGRIVRASCSRLTDGWTEWTVRLPAALEVAKGDYIVARAGTPDDEPGSDISEAIRKIPDPAAGETYAVQGSRVIRCSAVPGIG